MNKKLVNTALVVYIITTVSSLITSLYMVCQYKQVLDMITGVH